MLEKFQAALAKVVDRLEQRTEIDRNNLYELPRTLRTTVENLATSYQASEQRAINAAKTYPEKTAPAENDLHSLPSPRDVTTELNKLGTNKLATIRHDLREFRAQFDISANQTRIRVEIGTIPGAIIGIFQTETAIQTTILAELLNVLDLIIETCTNIIKTRKTDAITTRLAELDRIETRQLKGAISYVRLHNGAKIFDALDAALMAFANVRLSSYITNQGGKPAITIYDREGEKVVPYPIQVALPKLAKALGEEEGRTEIEQYLRHIFGLPNATPPHSANKEAFEEEMELRLQAIGL